MILVLGGTSVTHKVVEGLKDKDFIITLATDYGEREFRLRYPDNVMKIRFSEETMECFIKNRHVTEIIDTTHPHAAEITATAKTVACKCGIPYTNLVRKTEEIKETDLVHVFSNYEEAVCFLREAGFRRILFTTGSNNIRLFSEFAHNGWVRILPYEKSIEKCVQSGFERSRIIAMQGPFTTEFNASLFRELGIGCVVSKNSGEGSGFKEKLNACLILRIHCVIINPPEEEADR
ncbi:precorrin-6A reductase [Geovibrio thiophilus]|uniref:Precorrin-6A reductase n=1 Tax=Geovibrio thiophilus TaxID=139438 RepID=A0A410JZ78_9BACT|nr:precorrin-6A reductase [Geovibrio thiophilus]QAR33443.1 precorrin-6A reductase [Geovibrio thiophilus]